MAARRLRRDVPDAAMLHTLEAVVITLILFSAMAFVFATTNTAPSQSDLDAPIWQAMRTQGHDLLGVANELPVTKNRASAFHAGIQDAIIGLNYATAFLVDANAGGTAARDWFEQQFAPGLAMNIWACQPTGCLDLHEDNPDAVRQHAVVEARAYVDINLEYANVPHLLSNMGEGQNRPNDKTSL